jgi:hypothetical protein
MFVYLRFLNGSQNLNLDLLFSELVFFPFRYDSFLIYFCFMIMHGYTNEYQ